jgi:hypothetical protein
MQTRMAIAWTYRRFPPRPTVLEPHPRRCGLARHDAAADRRSLHPIVGVVEPPNRLLKGADKALGGRAPAWITAAPPIECPMAYSYRLG